MKKTKAPKKTHPTSGGGYVREKDGSLRQVEESTAPAPGKSARAAEAKNNVAPIKRAPAPTTTDQESRNG